MKLKDTNRIAQFEKAIRKKYGDLTVKNPKSLWDDEKEKEYLEQLKQFNDKTDSDNEMIECNGVLVPKKLIMKDSSRTCPVCNVYSFKASDDFYMNKFECCYKCYMQYVESREERWATGWRPNEEL